MSSHCVNTDDYLPKTIIYNHPDFKYHSAPGLSSSAIKCFINQSPRHYQWRYVMGQSDRRETEAMLLGTLVHCLVLEGDQFERRYERKLQLSDYPDAINKVDQLRAYCKERQLPTTGVKQELIERITEYFPDAVIWDKLLSRQGRSKKRIIKSELWDKARRMRDGVFDNHDAAQLFSDGKPEVSVWAEHNGTGKLTKCRCDWFRSDGICVDLKTCGCSSPTGFSKDCARLGYAIQEIHYTDTLNNAGQDCDIFVFVAVENEAPYLCQVYELDARSREIARRRYEQAFEQLADCQRRDYWPGYAEPVSELSLPEWHLKQLENAA